jgi:proline iminopeptidase
MPPIPPPRESGQTISTEVPLYWVRYGPGGARPILVLHGGPGAEHDYLLPQMLALGEGRRELVFYDQRGGGRSKTDDRTPITWQTQVSDLAKVIRELGLDAGPLTLAGYSWGGLLAMLYSIEAAAGRVAPAPAELLLIDPAPVTRRFREQFETEFARRQAGPDVKAMRDELNASGMKDSDPDQFRHRSFELSVAGYFADPRRARDLTPFRVIGRVQQSIWESLGDYDLATPEALGSVRARSIIVHGRQDPIPLVSSERAAALMGARLVAIDDCGHVPYVEKPAQLFAALDTFSGTR